MTDAIHCLPIPTPFAVGRVNCYLIEDDPLTLVDTGPNSGKALDALERALGEHGRRIEDLERIVITHQHLDHLGLVGILADRSGAEVCALDLLAPVLEEFGAHAERDDELAEALMLRNGIPRDVVTALRSVSRSFRGWGGSAPVDRPLADGGDAAVREPHAAGAPPARPLALGHAVLGRRARRPAGRRPPDRPHLVQPAHLPSAGRPLGRAGRRPPARADDVHGLAARDARACPPRSSSPATASRSPTTSP